MKTALEIALELSDKASAPYKRSMQEMERHTRSLDMRMSKMSSTVKALGAAFGGWQLARMGGDLLRLADQYTLLDNRLKLVTTGTANLVEIQGKLYDISQDTHGAFEGTVTLYSRFARATESAGTSQQDLLTITRAVNEAILVSGATSQEAEAAIIQLSQGLASGTLRGQELNSVLEQTPRVAHMIADGMGLTIGQLRAYGREGKLTTQAVIDALKSQAATVHTEFGKMAVTVGQAWQGVRNAFGAIVSDGNQATSVTATLAGELEDFTRYLDDHRDDIRAFFIGGVEGATEFGREALPVIHDLWTGITEVVDGYNNLDPVVKDLGIVLAVIGGKKGMAALAAVSAASAAGHKLSDELLNLMGITAQANQEWEGTVGVFSSGETAAGRLQSALSGLSSTFRDATGATAAEVNALESFYEAADTGAVVAKKAAKEACEAHKKQLTCAEKALKKEVDAAVKAGKTMTDNWQIQARDRDAVQSRSLDAIIQAESAANDAISADLESAMSEQDDLWGFHTETVKTQQSEMVNDLGRIFDGYINDVLHGQIDSVGDLFKGLFDSVLDMFLRTVAQMAANSLVDALFGDGAHGNGSTLGSALSSMFNGSSSGSSSGNGSLSLASTLGGAANTVSGWFGGPTISSMGTSAASSLGFGQTAVAPYVSGGAYQALGSTAAGTAGTVGAAYNASEVAALDAYYGSSLTAGTTAGASTASAGAGGGVGMGSAMAYGTAAAVVAAVAYGIFKNFTQTKMTPEQAAFGGVVNDLSGLGHHGLDYLNDEGDRVSAVAVKFSTEIEAAFNTLTEGLDYDIQGMTDRLAENFSSTGVDQFLEQMSDLPISFEQSATAMNLAMSAADGNSDSFSILEKYLESLGLTTEQAQASTVSMIEALNIQGRVTSKSVGAISGMTDAVNQLSNTDLDLSATARLNVEIMGDAQASSSIVGEANVVSHNAGSNMGEGEYAYWGWDDGTTGYNADGGIFTRPTVFRQVIGEAGPEAAIPLRHPKQLNHIEDKLDNLSRNLSVDRPIENNISLKIILDGKELDARIVAVNSHQLRQQGYRGEVMI